MDVKNYKLKSYTIEISTLGFISDISKFCHSHLGRHMPAETECKILSIVVSNSFQIYCNRNNAAY